MSQYEYFDEFNWAVPKAFSSPLAVCRFERGDVLYNTRRAYEGPWAESLPHIGYSLQVKSPDRGMSSGGKEDSDLFASNWNQRITFELTDHRAKKTREVTTAQGGLYGLLWRGTLDHIEGDLPKIAAPTTAMGLVSSSSFKSADIIDLKSLVNRLTGPSRQGTVTNLILSKLSTETITLLQDYPSSGIVKLKLKLIEDLNEVVTGPSIYDKQRFSEVALRPSTNSMLLLDGAKRKPASRLNRALLEDAFPGEFEPFRDHLSVSLEFFRKKLKGDGEKNGMLFLMPFDRCIDLLSTKAKSVESELSSEFAASVHYARPDELGLVGRNGFVPTAQVVCFFVPAKSASEVEPVLKRVLYTPTPGRQATEDKFRASAHGCFQQLSDGDTGGDLAALSLLE